MIMKCLSVDWEWWFADQCC